MSTGKQQHYVLLHHSTRFEFPALIPLYNHAHIVIGRGHKMAQTKSCGVLPTQGSRTFSAGRKNVTYSAAKTRAVPPRVQNGWKPAPTRSKPKHSDLPTDRVPVRPPSLPDHGPLFETAAAVPGPKLKLEEKRGRDLFTCPESASLAHCVSRDLSMSKGVAVAFKEKFKGVSSLKEQGM